MPSTSCLSIPASLMAFIAASRPSDSGVRLIFRPYAVVPTPTTATWSRIGLRAICSYLLLRSRLLRGFPEHGRRHAVHFYPGQLDGHPDPNFFVRHPNDGGQDPQAPLLRQLDRDHRMRG